MIIIFSILEYLISLVTFRLILDDDNGGRSRNYVDCLKLDITTVVCRLAQWSRGQEFDREIGRS